jgi:ParB/RepB/Spo0J family partition protein
VSETNSTMLQPIHEIQEKPPEIVMSPMGDLYVPDWNPRQFIDGMELEKLMAYRKKGGQVPPILVWKNNNQPPRAIISGQRRWEADKRLGKTQIAAIILDITLEDAKILAIASNTDNKPHWLGEFMAVENLFLENQLLQQAELAEKLGWSEKRVSQAIDLTDLFNQATKEQISLIFRGVVTGRNSIAKNKGNMQISKKPWQLTEDVAVRLIPLLNNPSRKAAQAQAEKVVQMIIDQQFGSCRRPYCFSYSRVP